MNGLRHPTYLLCYKWNKTVIYKFFIVCYRLLYWWFLEHLVNRDFNQLWVHELNMSVNKDWVRNIWVLKREIIVICILLPLLFSRIQWSRADTHGQWRYTCYYYLRIIDENKASGKHFLKSGNWHFHNASIRWTQRREDVTMRWLRVESL